MIHRSEKMLLKEEKEACRQRRRVRDCSACCRFGFCDTILRLKEIREEEENERISL